MGALAADDNLNDLPSGILTEIEPPREAAASHHTGKQATSERKGVPGLPSNDTHRRRSDVNDCIAAAAAGEIYNVVNMWAKGHPRSPQQISQMNEALSLVAEYTSKDSPRRPESIINNGGCLICGTIPLNRGVLKRHLNDMHHPQYVYSCPKPGCDTTQRRKDKIQAHIRTHPGFDSTSYERIELPCPAKCCLCPLTTTSWDAFYACVLSHHQTGGAQSERAASRNNDADHGKVTQVDSTQGKQSHRLAVPSNNLRRNRSNSSGRAAQGNPSGHRRLTPHTNIQPPRGRQPYPQRIQRPELPRGRRSSQREPSRRETRRPEPECDVCGHVFRTCPLENCRSRTSPCHECASRSMGSSAIPRVAQGSSQSQSPLEMGVPPLATVFSADPSWNPAPIPTGQEMQAFATGQFDPPTLQDLGSLNRAFFNEDLPGNSPQGNSVYFPNIWAARQFNSPTLSEEELCSPSPLASKLSPASVSVSAFPWSKTLPIGVPSKPCKDLSKLLTAPSSCPFSGKYHGSLP